jgi:hypothetical protein
VPNKRVFTEFYVNFGGHKLFFDFYVRELGLLVEVQGQQHFKFVSHFHGTKEKFTGQVNRDNLKIEYIQKEDLYLIYINYDEEITEELILSRITEAMNSETNYSGRKK